MIIKLSTGKELTVDEVREVLEKFKNLSEPKKKDCAPCPICIYPSYPAAPMNPYYGGIALYCQTQRSTGE